MIQIADRSVSISLRARVTDFVSGMGQAKRSTEDLSRQMQQTGAYAAEFRRRLEAATKALPKIEIDADSSPAEIKFAQLRAEMEKLSDKKIGIDISAADAQAQLQEIQRELEKLQGQSATIDVKADIGSALAELRAVDSEISRVNGKDASVRVDADVSSALGSIAMVGAALASLPAVTTLAVGVTALGGAFAAAGAGAAAFGAVAVPSLGRINDALKAQETAAKAAGGATGGAGQSAAQAAQQALQLEQAERRLKDAQVDRRQAQEDLTRAVEAGRRALEDMNFSLERSVLSQKDAELAVREAEARLTELQTSGKASGLDIERAMLGVEQAHQRAREQEVKTQRAKEDTAKANKEGVKGTKEYQDAQDRLTQAEQKVTDAAQQLKIAHLQQQAAMSGGGSAAAKLKDAFAGLNDEEKKLAKELKASKDAYIEWQRSLQPEVFPVISQALGIWNSTLPQLSPLVKSSAAAFSTLLTEAEKALAGPFWDTFLVNLNTQIPTAIIGLGRSFGNIATGFAGILEAFLPFTPTIVGGVEQATAAFATWGQNLANSPEFKEFIAYVKENAPAVWETIKDIAKAIGNIVEAIAPLGAGAFAGLGLLADIVAGMEPERIRDIALAIGAIKLATMGMSAISAWQGLAGGIAATGTAATKTSGSMAALGKASVAVAGGVIGLELVGDAVNKLDGQSAGIDKLTLALTELGQTGKWAGDLTTQWGGALGDTEAAIEGFRDDLAGLQDPNWYERIFKHPFTELGALLPGIDSAVDRMEQRFTDMDNALASLVSTGHADQAAAAFDQLAKQAEAQGIPVAKLNELLPTYNQAVRVAGNAAAAAAVEVDKGKLAMDGFNTSMSTFAGRTDALQTLQAMKTAFNEAEQAVNAANGKLQVNAQMTDKQRDAVILAREKFVGYVETVRQAADGAQTLSGRTTDGTRVILEQLPQLAALAGKNQEAREQIIKLAEAYGVSRDDAIKAMSSAKGLRDMIAQLKSKEIEITANTEKAKAALRDLLDIYIKPIEIPVGIRKPQAAGGINRYAAGGIDYRAAAGMQTRPQGPGIATKPTVLYGEGSSGTGATEAFIPYEPQYRDRAIALLSQVANDFGLSLNNQQAAQSLANLSVTIDESGLQISDNLTGVMGSLESTMGQAGSLTSSIDGVSTASDAMTAATTAGAAQIGDSAERMGTVTSDAVILMSTQTSSAVGTLTQAVVSLGSAVASAAAAASKSAATSGGSSGDSMTATRGTIPLKADPLEGNSVAGSYGTGGATTAPLYSTSGPVNASTVSAPVQMSSPSSSSSSESTPTQGSSGSWGREGAQNGPAVVIQNQTINSDVDANLFAESVAMKVRARGR